MAAVALIAIAALSAFSGGDGSTSASGEDAKLRLISARDAAGLIETRGGDGDFVVLDVRTPAEFASGHLAGAVNIDLNSPSFQAQVGALDRDRTYLVYCRSGNRSAEATKAMTRLDFADLYDMDGGIIAWSAAGLPVTGA